MAFTSTESYINPQPIDETSTTQKLPTGTIIKAKDDSLGVGEFIYLKGVASTVVGSVVAFDEADVTALAAANAKGRIGVAMSANVASSFGWYQISGKAHAKVLSSFADNGSVYLTATAGSIDDADVAGDSVIGAVGRSAISGGLAYLELNRPFVDNIAHD